MSIFNVDVGQIVARAEQRRLAIQHIQDKLQDLTAQSCGLVDLLEHFAEVGQDAKRLDPEAKELLGSTTMYRLENLGAMCDDFRRLLVNPSSHLSHVLAAIRD